MIFPGNLYHLERFRIDALDARNIDPHLKQAWGEVQTKLNRKPNPRILVGSPPNRKLHHFW